MQPSLIYSFCLASAILFSLSADRVLATAQNSSLSISPTDSTLTEMAFPRKHTKVFHAETATADTNPDNNSLAESSGSNAAFSDKSTSATTCRFRSNRPQTQTLLGANVRHGGFGSLIYGVTTVNGQTTFLRGTRGAWILNLSEQHALHIGLAGYRSHRDFDPVIWPHDDLPEPELRATWGGFELEYVNRSYRILHLGAQLLIGSGDVRYDDRDLDLENTRDNYFVLQPGANVFLNVTSWFRISGGVFYRHTGNVNLDGTSGSDLSGFSGILGLRLGRF